MWIFRNRTALISTDVAAMGLNVENLNLSVNIGKNMPIFHQEKHFQATSSVLSLTHFSILRGVEPFQFERQYQAITFGWEAI